MIYIYPYKMFSASARALRIALSNKLGYRVKLVRQEGRFKPRRDDKVINWGCSAAPRWKWGSDVDLNHPMAVTIASNKLLTFNRLREQNVSTPDWTQSREEAQEWLDNGFTIVVRHLLNGHSGQGIEVIQEGTVPKAPLYVKYKKKRSEYRVHVLRGEVIDTCQKKKSREANNSGAVNTFIRNYDNGWVYCRDGITPCPRRESLAIQAVGAIGLDFGAVDIIYNEHEDSYYVLEVNTAPGLEGTTLVKYTEKLYAMLKL